MTHIKEILHLPFMDIDYSSVFSEFFDFSLVDAGVQLNLFKLSKLYS